MPNPKVLPHVFNVQAYCAERRNANQMRRDSIAKFRSYKVNVPPPSSQQTEQTDNATPPPKHWYNLRGRRTGTLNEWRDALGAVIGGETAMPLVTPTDSKAGVFKKGASPLGGWSFLLFNYHNRTLINRPIGAINNLIKQNIISTPDGYDKNIASDATKGFSAIHGIWSSVVWGKRSYDIGYDMLADVASAKDRHKMQKLLKQFNPHTCRFISPTGGGNYDSSYKYQQMQQLMAKKYKWNTSDGANIWRSHKQRTLDLLTRTKDNTITLISTAIPNLVLVGAQPSNNLLQAGLAITTAGHGLATLNNFTRFGVQCSAIANIEKARRIAKRQVNKYQLTPDSVHLASTNQLIVNASNRMIQERTYQSRLFFFQGISYALSTIGCGLASSVGGIPSAVFFLGSAITIPLVGGIQQAFTFWHGRKVAQRRSNNSKDFKAFNQEFAKKTGVQKLAYIRDLDSKKKIGYIERHLLDTLRNGDKEDSMAVYEFFKACGISDNTIKSFMLMDEAKALGAMQNQMYNARTHVIGANRGQAHRVIGYITGIKYMRRCMKNKQLNRKTDMTDHSKPYVVKVPQIQRFPSTESLPKYRTRHWREDALGRIKK